MKKIITAVIDAGSSGSRLFLYEVLPGLYPVVTKIAEYEYAVMPNGKREEGINNFVCPSSPEVESSVFPLVIQPLLDSILPILAQMSVQPAEVEVNLLATAGMRYAEKMFGHQAVLNFYDQIRCGIQASGFMTGEIRTTDGQREEGVWTWLNFNDVELDLFRTDTSAMGIVEVGGSSLQLSFPVSKEFESDECVQLICINGREIRLYCKSYMGLGQDDARKEMRIKLAEQSSRCFPTGFPAQHDQGDVLDGVGHFRLARTGDFDFTGCNAVYEDIILNKIKSDPMPDIGALQVEFVGTDAIYHATSYWKVENDPLRLAAMIMDQCLTMDKFPGIESNEFIQAQAANSTYIRTLLYGRHGLFSACPNQLVKAVSNKTDSGHTRLTWTRGYLFLKHAR